VLKNSGSETPKSPLDGRTSGRDATLTPNNPHNSSLHVWALMSYSIVRDAFVGSVANTAPPVSLQISHASTVPNANRARASLPRDRRSLSIHSNFVAGK